MAQRQARTEPRSTLAFVLSVGMHVAFFAVLFFAISWKTKPPAPVVAELWTPPPAAVPRPTPKPTPKPPPKVAPPPEPKIEEKPPEKVDIALEQEKERQRLEEERKRLEAIEQKRRKDEEARKREEAEKKRKEEAARAEAEKKRKEDEARAKAEQEKKERAAQAAADKRLASELERETQKRMMSELAKASPQSGRTEGVAASAPGDPNALAGYRDKISAKIRGNVILPQTLSGDPEAEFLVEQLPTGEIISVKLTRSSGNKALDDAWERAILKSSPLPLPEQREVFQRNLRLKFRPSDKR
jgi:colicin import membrane protein